MGEGETVRFMISDTQLHDIARLVPIEQREKLYSIYDQIQKRPLCEKTRGYNLDRIPPEVREYISHLPKGKHFHISALRKEIARECGIELEGTAIRCYLLAIDNIRVNRDLTRSTVNLLYEVV